jgi:hypothetical protein
MSCGLLFTLHFHHQVSPGGIGGPLFDEPSRVVRVSWWRVHVHVQVEEVRDSGVGGGEPGPVSRWEAPGPQE